MCYYEVVSLHNWKKVSIVSSLYNVLEKLIMFARHSVGHCSCTITSPVLKVIGEEQIVLSQYTLGKISIVVFSNNSCKHQA